MKAQSAQSCNRGERRDESAETAEMTAEHAEKSAEAAEMIPQSAQSEPAETAEKNKEELNHLTEQVIGLAIKIHKALGPGFVEQIYEQALAHEFNKAGLAVRTQQGVRVRYEGVDLGRQRIDLIVGDAVIVELKCVSRIMPLHQAQLLSYLKATEKRVGLILNFARTTLNVKRMVNRF